MLPAGAAGVLARDIHAGARSETNRSGILQAPSSGLDMGIRERNNMLSISNRRWPVPDCQCQSQPEWG